MSTEWHLYPENEWLIKLYGSPQKVVESAVKAVRENGIPPWVLTGQHLVGEMPEYEEALGRGEIEEDEELTS